MKNKKHIKSFNEATEKLHISDVIVSKTDKPIKLQLMSLYGTFNKTNKKFKFY